MKTGLTSYYLCLKDEFGTSGGWANGTILKAENLH